MRTKPLLYTTLALTFFAQTLAFADPLPSRADGRLIEPYAPAEVVCLPPDDSTGKPETIALEAGQNPLDLCPANRVAGFGFYPEILSGESGEPPPAPFNEAEAAP